MTNTFIRLSLPCCLVDSLSTSKFGLHMSRIVLMLAITVATTVAFAEERAWDLLKDKSFRAAYHKTLGAKRSEKWIAKLFGPSQETTRQKIGQTEYIFADSCRPHYCDTNNLVIAYVPSNRAVFVKLVEDRNVSWLGNPSTEVKTLLENYYALRFQP
jgi:Inhibitor of vertebrate lysozyme (Ivy)